MIRFKPIVWLAGVRRARRLLPSLAMALWLMACGGGSSAGRGIAGGTTVAMAATEAGDFEDEAGRHFYCEGDGPNKDQALTAAQAICTDKVCRVCGVQIESVVETTETLDGVSMERKVVERCRRFRKEPLSVERETMNCGPSGCIAQLAILFSKADEEKECSMYASESFDDPERCEALVQAFRQYKGRDAASFRGRAELLNEALGACAGIDMRPTPLLAALSTQLEAGMDAFEFTSRAQQERQENSSWHRTRQDVMTYRSPAEYHLTTQPDFRAEFRETKTLVGQIQMVRDYVSNRALAFDVMEATEADSLDSQSGVARLLAALAAAPQGAQYGAPDVHFYPIYTIRDLRADISSLIAFYRRSYPPPELPHDMAIPLAVAMTQDGKVDDSDWQYVFSLHRKRSCPVCITTLLDVENHGGAAVREKRFAEALHNQLGAAGTAARRERAVAAILPHDSAFLLKIKPSLPADVQTAPAWDVLARHVRDAEEAGDGALRRQLTSAMVERLRLVPSEPRENRSYCLGLGAKLTYLAERGVSGDALGDPICGCLTGALAEESTRSSVNKSELYDFALALGVPCVQPE